MSKIKNNENYFIKMINDFHENITIDIFGKNNKKIMSVNYEILGSYDDKLKLFSWACNHQLVNKKMIKLSNQIRKSVNQIKKLLTNFTYSDVEYLEKLHYYLSNSVFFINNDNISELLHYCLYFSKGMGIIENDTFFMDKHRSIKMFYIVTDIIG